ncbi:putative BTB/POZ domain-containing protein-like [Capsicum annuum]|nr:putative BTB/POZ domain-containing protein-like [Capsicum annuum]
MTNESQMQDAATTVGATSIALTSRANAPQPMAPTEKPGKFTGIDFKFTSEDAPEVPEGTSDKEHFMIVEAWKHSDFLCRNYILSGFQDDLYNVYSVIKTSKELWGVLEQKYKIEDAEIKKYFVARFLDFKMIDSKSIVSQVQELQVIIHDLLAEEDNKVAERRSKGNSTINRAHIVEDDQNNSMKRKKAEQGSHQPKKKFKGKCFNCGKIDHKSMDCRAPKKGKKKDQAIMIESNKECDDLCAMFSECSLVGNPREWWMDSGATRYVCANKELFSSFAPAQVEEIIYMANSAMAKELVDLPLENKPLGSKWIFKRKMIADGTIDNYMARLVVKGFKQKEGLDYFDTYSPVIRITSIGMLIALAAVYGLEIHQMDVKIPFLNGELEEEIYMKQPGGFVVPRKENKSKFGMNDLGVADVILGIRIHRTPQGLTLSQSHYIENVLDKFKYMEFGIAKTPLDVSFALRKNKGESDSQLEYARVLGCLLSTKVLQQKTKKMYVEESGCFDADTHHVQNDGVLAEDVFAIQEQHTYHHNPSQQDVAAAAALEIEFQQQLNLEMEECYNNTHNNNMQDQLIHDQQNNNNNNNSNQGLSCDQSNWGEMNFPPYQNQEDSNNINNHNNFQQQNFPIPMSDAPYLTTPDLLNMFPLPRCSQSSLLPQKSPNLLTSLELIGDIDGGASTSNAVYDPSLVLPLNLPPQPPLLRELFHSFPHGYGLRNLRSNNNTSFFNGMEERDQVNGALYQDNGEGRPFDNGIFEFSAGMNDIAKNRDGIKETKHFATERQRRVHLNDKYKALRSMVPNPSKTDRASIVKDAIDYINELKRGVNELKLMVEKKRCSKDRIKRQKKEDGTSLEGLDAKQMDEVEQSYNGNSLRSSWLQRRSKNTEVDVRIVDDEVTVKLVQQKRINCLLFASKVLDELQLDLHHVAGGLIGDYYSFLFNSKISEGSTVYASAIAKKLIEVVDIQYAAIAPANSY